MTPLPVYKDILCWSINSDSLKPNREFEGFDCARRLLAYAGGAEGLFFSGPRCLLRTSYGKLLMTQPHHDNHR